jgi:hypothetical protein
MTSPQWTASVKRKIGEQEAKEASAPAPKPRASTEPSARRPPAVRPRPRGAMADGGAPDFLAELIQRRGRID